jgi:hypothetical protein
MNTGNINFENRLYLQRQIINQQTLDVIIPNIGKNYLYDVLQDLAKQTHLPVNVIIVDKTQINKVFPIRLFKKSNLVVYYKT